MYFSFLAHYTTCLALLSVVSEGRKEGKKGKESILGMSWSSGGTEEEWKIEMYFNDISSYGIATGDDHRS